MLRLGIGFPLAAVLWSDASPSMGFMSVGFTRHAGSSSCCVLENPRSFPTFAPSAASPFGTNPGCCGAAAQAGLRSLHRDIREPLLVEPRILSEGLVRAAWPSAPVAAPRLGFEEFDLALSSNQGSTETG